MSDFGERLLNNLLRELERGVSIELHHQPYRPPHSPYHGGQRDRPDGVTERELQTLQCLRDPWCITRDEASAMNRSDGGLDLNELSRLLYSRNERGDSFISLSTLTKAATSCVYEGHVGDGERLVPNTTEVHAQACRMVLDRIGY